MKETGVLKNLIPEKGFGFISRDSGGQQVFVPPGEIKKSGAKQGDRLEFEVQTDPKKQDRFAAVNVTVVSSAEPNTSSTTPATQAALGVILRFEPRDIIEVQTPGGAPDGKRLRLLVRVTLKRGNNPVAEEEVQIEPDGIHAVEGEFDLSNTTLEGEAVFFLLLPENVMDARVTVLIAGKRYHGVWQKDSPKAETKPQPDTVTPKPATRQPQKPQVKRLDHQGSIYTFEITGSPNAIIKLKSELEVETREAGSADNAWTSQPIQLGADGKTTRELRVPKVGDYGKIRFSDGNLDSNPEFISNS
jgi:CspA family cold shock protein